MMMSSVARVKFIKGTVMQIKKALINDSLLIPKVS